MRIRLILAGEQEAGWRLNCIQETRDSKIDIFSLGLVFAYTLCIDRKHPFSDTPGEAQTNIKNQKAMTIDEESLDIQDIYTRDYSLRLSENMLRFDPNLRLKIGQVLEMIQYITLIYNIN